MVSEVFFFCLIVLKFIYWCCRIWLNKWKLKFYCLCICLKVIENFIFGLFSFNCCLIEIFIVMFSICICFFEILWKIVICLLMGVFREGLMCFCKVEIDFFCFVCILIVWIWIKIFIVYCWGEFKWYLWLKFVGEFF